MHKVHFIKVKHTLLHCHILRIYNWYKCFHDTEMCPPASLDMVTVRTCGTRGLGAPLETWHRTTGRTVDPGAADPATGEKG